MADTPPIPDKVPLPPDGPKTPQKPPESGESDKALGEFSQVTQTLIKAFRKLLHPVTIGHTEVWWGIIWAVGFLVVNGLEAWRKRLGLTLAIVWLIGALIHANQKGNAT